MSCILTGNQHMPELSTSCLSNSKERLFAHYSTNCKQAENIEWFKDENVMRLVPLKSF